MKKTAVCQIGNRFVLISSSVKASPYVDCLCIASLWAWLVAKDPTISYGHYHWKYIDLLGDDWRYEIVRATLANCSHELSSPKNAGQMLEVLDAQYNLKFSMGGKNSFETEIQEVICIAGGINENHHYRADLYIHFTDQQVEDELGFIIDWKLTSKRANTGSLLARRFALTKRLSFKNEEAVEYQPAELVSLFQSDLLSHAKNL